MWARQKVEGTGKARGGHEQWRNTLRSYPIPFGDLLLYVHYVLPVWDRWFHPVPHHGETANAGITRPQKCKTCHGNKLFSLHQVVCPWKKRRLAARGGTETSGQRAFSRDIHPFLYLSRQRKSVASIGQLKYKDLSGSLGVTLKSIF